MDYKRHSHFYTRKAPAKTQDLLPHNSLANRFNTWLAIKITTLVGTMWCAYVFGIIALISLPAALASGQLIIIVAWIAQTFLQLVLLSIIIVGQNIAAEASDKRAENTYNDAEVIMQDVLQMQQHLQEQDAVLNQVLTHAENISKNLEHSTNKE